MGCEMGLATTLQGLGNQLHTNVYAIRALYSLVDI